MKKKADPDGVIQQTMHMAHSLATKRDAGQLCAPCINAFFVWRAELAPMAVWLSCAVFQQKKFVTDRTCMRGTVLHTETN